MAILRTKEIRKMNPQQRAARLKSTRDELLAIRAKLSSGGSIEDPGRIKELKRVIARIITVQRELGEI